MRDQEITAAQNNPPNGEGEFGLAALSAHEEYETIDSNGVQERINVLETLSQESRERLKRFPKELRKSNEEYGSEIRVHLFHTRSVYAMTDCMEFKRKKSKKPVLSKVFEEFSRRALLK